MNTVFASASALLATEFIERLAVDKLDLVLVRISKETGVTVDRSTERFIITGKWSWVLESYNILLEEYKNVSKEKTEPDIAWNDDSLEVNRPIKMEYSKEVVPSTLTTNTVMVSQSRSTNEQALGFTKLIRDQIKSSATSANFNKDSQELDKPDCEIKLEKEAVNMQDYDDHNTCVYDMDTCSESSGIHTEVTRIIKLSQDSRSEVIKKSEQFIEPDELHNIKVKNDGCSTKSHFTRGSLKAKILKKGDEATKTCSCCQCNYVGKNRLCLKAHNRRCHVKSFTCDQCQSSFGYNKDLTRHKKQVHGGEISEECRKRGRKKTIYEPTVFACDKCPYIGKGKELLREHKRRLHGIRFHCDECDKGFGFNKDLNRHKRDVHCPAEFLCTECKKFFKTKRSLDIHSKCHEADYVRHAFECQVCDKRYSTKYVLDNHIKTEHMGIKKSYVCPVCGKSFTQKGSYHQHANVHAGLRPYVCDVCGKSFSYENALKSHKYLHEDLRRFHCNICDKHFLHKNSLRIHKNVHRDTRDYICTLCGHNFSQKQSLIRHQRIHSGDKPFLCTVCQKTFRDSSVIRRHMILIHKKDPKKWQEDMVNNVAKAPNHFVEVLGVGINASAANPQIKISVQNHDSTASVKDPVKCVFINGPKAYTADLPVHPLSTNLRMLK